MSSNVSKNNYFIFCGPLYFFQFFVVAVVVLFSNKYNGKVVAGLNVLCSLAREFISECLAPIMICMNVTSNYKLTNMHWPL